MRDALTWYTIDNLAGDSWSDSADDFVDAEGDFDKYDEEVEAVTVAEALRAMGERNTSVTKHTVRRDGVEHTRTVWEA